MKLIIFNASNLGVYQPETNELNFNTCYDICYYRNTDRCTCECVNFNQYESRTIPVEHIENHTMIKDGWYQKVNFNPDNHNEYELKPITCEIIIKG